MLSLGYIPGAFSVPCRLSAEKGPVEAVYLT